MSQPRNLNAVDLIRFWAIFFMMYAHYRVGDLTGLDSYARPDGAIFQALHFGLSRTSSAFLGITSGYFVYRQIARYGFPQTLRKRFASLVVPAISWSVIFLLFTAGTYFVVTNRLPPELTQGPWRALNKVIPIQYWPANFPLHYLVDLFKLCLVAPILIFVIEKVPAPGKIAIIVALILFPNSVSDPGNSESILPRWDLIVFFVTGLAIASEKISLEDLLSHRIPLALVIGALVLVLALAPFWESLLKSDDFQDRYVGYLMIMAIKILGIILFSGIAQRCVSSAFFASVTPERETIFTAFCLHAVILYYLVRIADKADDILATNHAVAFVSFLVFPATAFAGALLLKRTRVFLFERKRVRTS